MNKNFELVPENEQWKPLPSTEELTKQQQLNGLKMEKDGFLDKQLELRRKGQAEGNEYTELKEKILGLQKQIDELENRYIVTNNVAGEKVWSDDQQVNGMNRGSVAR